MSLAMMSWAFLQKDLRPIEKIVLLVLSDYANDDGECYPGQAKIAERADCSERTVRTALKSLAERGLISSVERRRDDGYRTSNLYILNIPGRADSAGEDSYRQNEGTSPAKTGDLTGKNDTPHRKLFAGQEPLDKPSGNPLDNPSVADAAFAVEPKSDPVGDQFAEIWAAWPRKDSKKDAEKAWRRLSASVRDEVFSKALVFAKAYPLNREARFVPYLSSWLNGELWNDPIPEPRHQAANTAPVVNAQTPIGRDGLPAPYGVTPNGRRIGPPPRMGEHPRSPYLGDRWLAAASGETLISRLNPSVYREPTEHERRILRGETDD